MYREPVLIETYWNVNTLNEVLIEDDRCINRNILECKYKYQANITEGETVLIETYWNVNVNFHHGTIHSRSVLIETYWNVNYHNQEQSY